MSDESQAFGSIGFADLTVPDADTVRDFYAAVVGWRPEPVDMGGYSDWMMQTEDGTSGVGICWSRGVNAGQPGGWVIYLLVRDLEASLAACAQHGGEQVGAVRGSLESGRWAVIRDPSGAVCALFQPA